MVAFQEDSRFYRPAHGGYAGDVVSWYCKPCDNDRMLIKTPYVSDSNPYLVDSEMKDSDDDSYLDVDMEFGELGSKNTDK